MVFKFSKWIVTLLIVSIIMVSNSLFVFAEDFKLGPVVRVGDKGTKKICTGEHSEEKGRACLMNRSNAKKYCASHGLRLPTAKEFGLTFNPHGVSDTSLIGFYVISAKDTKKTTFYYNPYTFEQIPCDPEKAKTDLSERDRCDDSFQQILTGSLNSYDLRYAYAFDGPFGDLSVVFPETQGVVHCTKR